MVHGPSTLNTTISCFIWKDQIFKVPLSTLHRGKAEGGWGLIHFEAKSYSLFIMRMHAQISNTNALSPRWLQMWSPGEKREIHSYMPNIPHNAEYMKRYYIETAYAPRQRPEKRTRAYKRRFYKTMLHIHSRSTYADEMRIQNYGLMRIGALSGNTSTVYQYLTQ
jgi:hypothetical protein